MPPYETVRFPGSDILHVSPKTFLFVINANVKLLDEAVNEGVNEISFEKCSIIHIK